MKSIYQCASKYENKSLNTMPACPFIIHSFVIYAFKI